MYASTVGGQADASVRVRMLDTKASEGHLVVILPVVIVSLVIR
jgi:hypothetical protein